MGSANVSLQLQSSYRDGEGSARVTHIDPRIQTTDAICIVVLRESLSAMKEEESAPMKEPAGMAHVMPPCR
jgi:hypothetical protein